MHMRDIIRISNKEVGWMSWISLQVVDLKVAIELVEYKIDSLNPVLQDIYIR